MTTARTATKTGRLDHLRDCILTGRGEDLTEAELLELLVSIALHRLDVQDQLAELVRRFGSISRVFSATPNELRRVKGIGEAVAVLLKIVDLIRSSKAESFQPSKAESFQPATSRDTNHQAVFKDLPLFRDLPEIERAKDQSTKVTTEQPAKTIAPVKAPQTRPGPRGGTIRAVQDLIWKEALLSLPWSEKFEDLGEFQSYIREHLPQNSLSTRDRYAQTVVRWFYPDGLKGLTAEVWRHYQDTGLAEEILRYRYLCAETMAGAIVADALFPIGENASIPDSYIAQFTRERFGSEVPGKTTERLKANLRKLGFLSLGKERRDSLRPLAPSATAFLVLLHFRFSQGHPGGVEFRAMASDPFWKYLGFKSEDRLRAILREALDHGLIAKYVVADRIESISLRYSFREFAEGRMRL